MHWGFGNALLLHVPCQIVLFLAARPLGAVLGAELPELVTLLPLIWIGLSQLVYLGPMWLLMEIRGRHASAKGVAIAIVLTFLVNTGCWGALRVAA